MNIDNIEEAMKRAHAALPSVEEAAARLNELSAILAKMKRTEDKQPELFHGYTMEQWQRIIDGGYLCEFWDDDGRGRFYATLKEVDKEWPNPFTVVYDNMDHDLFPKCRPAQRYGVLTPHFGGPKPEWLKDDDLIVWWKNEEGRTLADAVWKARHYPPAGKLTWQADDEGNVGMIEFIAMPGAPK